MFERSAEEKILEINELQDRQFDLWTRIFSLNKSTVDNDLKRLTKEELEWFMRNLVNALITAQSLLKNPPIAQTVKRKNEINTFLTAAKKFGVSQKTTLAEIHKRLQDRLKQFQNEPNSTAHHIYQLVNAIDQPENAPEIKISHPWSDAFTETFPFTGYDPVYKVHYLPDVPEETVNEFARSNVTRISSFFGLSNRMRREPEPASWADIARQFLGLPERDEKSASDYIWHSIKAASYIFLKPIFIVLPNTILNTVKMFFEFPLNGAKNSFDVQRQKTETGSAAHGFATLGFYVTGFLHFIARAITSPEKGRRAGRKLGQDLGDDIIRKQMLAEADKLDAEARQQLDAEEAARLKKEATALRTTAKTDPLNSRLGKVLGFLFMASSLTITAATYTVIFPLGIKFLALQALPYIAAHAPGVIAQAAVAAAKGITAAVNAIQPVVQDIGNPVHHVLKLLNLANLSVQSLVIATFTSAALMVALPITRTIDTLMDKWKLRNKIKNYGKNALKARENSLMELAKQRSLPEHKIESSHIPVSSTNSEVQNRLGSSPHAQSHEPSHSVKNPSPRNLAVFGRHTSSFRHTKTLHRFNLTLYDNEGFLKQVKQSSKESVENVVKEYFEEYFGNEIKVQTELKEGALRVSFDNTQLSLEKKRAFLDAYKVQYSTVIPTYYTNGITFEFRERNNQWKNVINGIINAINTVEKEQKKTLKLSSS